jgi:putative DNA modification/repair radical SAM protein
MYLLREVYGFGGYIHAKVIPGVSPEVLAHIGLVCDRLSVNVELPSETSLQLLAPQKKPKAIFSPMKQIRQIQAEQHTLKSAGLMEKLRPIGDNVSVGDGSLGEMLEFERSVRANISEKAEENFLAGRGDTHLVASDRRKRYKEKFAPAGQTTQMIIGASPESDRTIIRTSETLYRSFSLKRVYFSAYIPISDDPNLPMRMTPPPLLREHRLYQADWLLRFYGFSADEILTEDEPNLDYELDPKIIWALRHIEFFPVEINKASWEELLRIPGVGNVSAKRIMRQRKIAAVKYDDLKKMGVVLKRARFFMTCSGRYYGDKSMEPIYIRDKVLHNEGEAQPLLDRATVRRELSGGSENPQLSMFDFPREKQLVATPAFPSLSAADGFT